MKLDSNITCTDRKYLPPVSFFPIFLVSWTIADSTERCQSISATHNQRRFEMKISQALTHFYDYQRMNVKKKYVAQL